MRDITTILLTHLFKLCSRCPYILLIIIYYYM